jgi:hypothetical protein
VSWYYCCEIYESQGQRPHCDCRSLEVLNDDGGGDGDGPPCSVDFIRAEAAKKRSIAEGGGKKAKNKGQDLSFLDAALETDVTKIKKASGGKKKK